MKPARKEQPQPQQPTPTDPRAVTEALAEIARDVRQQPEQYLEHSLVPGGGE